MNKPKPSSKVEQPPKLTKADDKALEAAWAKLSKKPKGK